MDWSWSNIDWTRTLATLVGVATVIQAVAAILMVRGVRHAETSSRIASEALKLSRSTAVQQLRAYLELSISELQSSSSGAAIKLLFENTGQTPAINVCARIQYFFGPPGTVANWVFPNQQVYSPKGSIGASGKATFLQTIPPEHWNENVAGLQDGTTTVGVVVELKYEDVFDHERHLLARRQLAPSLHATQFAVVGGDEMT